MVICKLSYLKSMATTTVFLPYNNYLISNSKMLKMKSKYLISHNKLINMKKKKSKSQQVPHISIVGVSKVCSSNYSLPARFAWLLMLLILASLCAIQLQKCVCLYFSNPVIKQTDIIRKPTVTFPAIYICSGIMRQLQNIFHKLKDRKCSDKTLLCATEDPFERAVLKFVPSLNNNSIQNLSDMLNQFNFHEKIKVYTSCGQVDEECDLLGKEWNVSQIKFHSFWGECIGLDTVLEVEYKGPFTYLKIQNTYLFYDQVIKKIKDDLITKTNKTEIDIIRKSLKRTKIGLLISTYHKLVTNRHHFMYFESLEIFQGFETHIQLHRKEFDFYHRKQYSCENEETVTNCYNACFEKIMSTICRMPYSHNASVPLCENWSEETVNVHLDNNEAYNKFNFSKCNCPPICNQIMYTMSTDVIERLYDESDVLIKFYFSDDTYDKTTEKYSYDFTACLSDFGGNLGFFLGFCSLTIAELIEVALFHLRRIIE